jgi:hypothetical protein
MVNQDEPEECALPKVVSVGDLSKAELLTRLTDSGIHLNQAAQDLFSETRFQPRREASEAAIAARSVSDLGFDGGATYAQITARASGQGLAECPLELAAYLRLQFLDQPEAGKRPPSAERGSPPGAITIASKPLDDSDEVPKGFYLRNIEGVLWLRGYWSDAIHIWNDDDVLVFTLNKT